MVDLLRIVVVVAAAWALLALTALIVRARAWGRVEYFARAAAPPMAGVVYAFGAGMSPTAKESAREHLTTYLAGVAYHIGVFASLAYLVLLVAGVGIGGVVLLVLQLLTLLATICGATLLIRRVADRQLRRLSCPDDYVANLLTTGMVALACVATVSPRLQAPFLGESALLLLYMPLGKIKHCFFFFTTRYYLGAHFGRRGTFPPRA